MRVSIWTEVLRPQSFVAMFWNGLGALCFFCLVSGVGAMAVQAGPYGSFGIRSAQFALKPSAEEPTPNYYAYGPRMSAGYSLRQVLDVGIFFTGLPASRGHASTNNHDARLLTVGGEIALRLAQSIYLGVYGGKTEYRLRRATPTLAPGLEWAGKHAGIGWGVSLGALIPFSKENFAQVSLDFEEHRFKAASRDTADSGESAPDKDPARVIECFGVTFAFTFNSYHSYLIENQIFKDFLN